VDVDLDLAADPLLAVPGPVSVHPRVIRAMMRIVDHRSPQFHRLFSELVEGLRALFRTSGDVYPLTASGTGAVEAMVMNFISPKDTVVVPVFGSFGRRLVNHIRKIGAEVVELRYDWGQAPSLEDIKARVESMGLKEFSVFATVYNETNPGVAFRDLPRVSSWAHSMGSLVLVDNVSALGGDYFEVDKWGLDVAVSSSQKCIAAPPVMSFIAVATKEAYEKLSKVDPPSIYFDIKLMKKFSEKHETPFTPSVNHMFAIREAINIIMEIGLDEWIRWHVERGNAVVRSLTALGLEPFVPKEHRSTTVLSFKYPNIDPASFREGLYRLGIAVSDAMDELRGRVFRIGNMGYLLKRDILALISAIATMCMSMNCPIADLGGSLREATNYWEPRRLNPY